MLTFEVYPYLLIYKNKNTDAKLNKNTLHNLLVFDTLAIKTQAEII